MPGGHEDPLIRLSERMGRRANEVVTDGRVHRTGNELAFKVFRV